MKRYEKYKDSGIEWIGEVPEGWSTNRIKYMYSFGRGLNITKADLTPTGTPVISYGQIHSPMNVGTTIHDTLLRFVPKHIANEHNECKVKSGDFIFADTSEDKTGCGNCVYIDREGIYAGYHSLVLDGKGRNNKYFAYLFKSDEWRKQIRARVSGVKVFSITQNILSDCSIVIPTQKEQYIIVEYLDYKVGKIDKAVEGINAQIEDLKGYRQSVISEAVTKGINSNVKMKDSGVVWIGEIPGLWNVNRLRELCSIFGRIGFRGYTQADLVSKGEGAITLSPSNFSNGLLDYSKCSYISWNKYYESPEIMIDNGDVLLVKTASIGKVALVTNMPEKCTLNPQIVVLKDLSIDNRFLAYALQTPYLQSQVESNAIGSTIKTLSQEKIGKFVVCVPPINEQKEIATYLDEKTSKIDGAIKALERQREDLGALKQSVISEAVTGKVDVRGWNN